ncbi:Cilia- and flagella-associated protein 44 [Allomyces arbusculus]|nr:Cilia- and flagella-associated protein 44 [Allomyces arbusculus]
MTSAMDHDAFDVPPLEVPDLADDGLFYPDDSLVRPHAPGELERDRLTLAHALGFPASRRSSLVFLSPTVVVYAVSNVAVFLNIVSHEQRLLQGLRCGGISAVAVHPARNLVALAETHANGPNIYLYSFPDLRLFRVLRHGAEKSFTMLAFSQDGASLASVAAEPDYTLTVWDWRRERVVLRSKAFSQDVHHVAFNPTNDQVLVTSGMGHIKFWRMAATFTGLKLQGVLGKFGATELTDIPCFVFLPSGRVLAGTETGNLLLWDGGFIKCEVAGPGARKCHAGSIETCIVRNGDLITAGDDGYMRVWDLDAIEGPEPNTEGKAATATIVYEIEPTAELHIGKDVRIKCARAVPDSESEYLVVDATGGLWRVDLAKRSSERIAYFHADQVAALDYSFAHHYLTSVGRDGSVRLHDPLTRNALAVVKHSVPGTAIKYAPKHLDGLGCALVAGFDDGSVRFFRHADKPTKNTLGIARTHAFRPHAHAVVAIAFSSDATVMATAGAAGTVFVFALRLPNTVPAIFDRKVVISPVGLIKLPFEIQSLVWALDSQVKSTTNRIRGRFLVLTPTGDMYQLQVNLDKQYEKEHNFVIPEADYELAPWTLQKYLEPTIAVQITQGQVTDGQPAAATAAAPAESTEAKPSDGAPATVPTTPAITYRLTHAVYTEQDHILVTIERSDGQVELRSCLLSDPKISRLLLTLRTPVTALHIVPSGKLILLGCADGTVYYRPITFDADVNLANAGGHQTTVYAADEYYWRSHVHAGAITGVATTFDDALLTTGGADGGLFVFKSNLDDLVHRAINIEGITLPPLEDADDLSNKYTIQEAKMMTKLDEETALAEHRKRARLAQVEQLQREFEAVYAMNQALPEGLRVPNMAFQIDPGLVERIALETEAKVQKVHNHMLWSCEKVSIALRKLKKRYYDSVLSEVEMVESIQNGLQLFSFRTERIESSEVSRALAPPPGDAAEADARHQPNGSSQQAAQPNKAHLHAKTDTDRPRPSIAPASFAATTAAPTKNDSRMDHAARLEERRRIKAERLEQWKQLMNSKPSSASEDPRDVAAIRYAETHMGDYKLKMDKNYIVPENERVNAEMKRKQIILLQESLIRIMESFNRKVQTLKKRKAALCEAILERNQQIQRIEADLAELGVPSAGSRVFSSPVLEAPLAAANKPDTSSRALHRLRQIWPQDSTVELSPQDMADRKRRIKCLEYELGVLEKKNTTSAQQFDTVLEAMCVERVSVASDIHAGEMRLLLLFKEWRLLKEFEKHDQQLSEKLMVKLSEKADIDAKILDIQAKIAEKRHDIEQAAETRKEIEDQLAKVIGDGNKHEDLLVKMFRKKVKRKRRKDTGRAADAAVGRTEGDDELHDEEESEEEESDDDDDSDDDPSGDEAVSDECPPGCDPNMHAQVLALRDRRLDLEDDLADVQKAIETFKKDNEIFGKKEKVIAAALKQTDMEIQEFQTQKQQKLNELDVVVPLAFHQIQYLDEDLANALVFPDNGLDMLQERIKETEQETEQVRKDHKELKREHVNLLALRKEKKSKLQELEGKCAEVQMLKFGRIVDLEKLERMGMNKAAEDLRQQLAAKEKQYTAKLEKWEKKIAALKKELTASIVTNTERLNTIYDLTQRKKRIESALDAEQESVTAEFSGPAKQDVIERERLLDTIRVQAEHIEALKRELADMMRKPTAPRPALPVRHARAPMGKSLATMAGGASPATSKSVRPEPLEVVSAMMGSAEDGANGTGDSPTLA